MTEQNKGPTKTIRAGGVVGKIWENPGKEGLPPMKNGQILRTYKDAKTDEWKETNNFQQNDLPKVSLVAQLLYKEMVVTKENDQD